MGAFTSRYEDTITGAITFTGNTVGLSKEEGSNNAGVEHSIGAFISTNPALNYDSYATINSVPTNNNSGSTLNIADNGSFAFLTLPAGSTIVYADLIWGGSFQVGSTDLEAQISNPIDFYVGTTKTTINPTSLTPPLATKYESASNPNYYFWIREVTSLLSSLTSGTTKITVEDIVATTVPSSDTSNCGGWTLCVVYENDTMPSRNITLFCGNDSTFVGSGNDVVSTVTGFQTAPTGQVNGRILFTAMEGDAVLTGDSASISNSGGVYHTLFGPRNPASNFFGSQINDDLGNTDFLGSFGFYNQNPITETNIVGGRQGWDITNVNANPAPFINLDNNQTETNVQCTSDGDRYWVTAVGLQLDINAPFVQVSKSANKSFASIGEEIEYTITIKNTGTAVASNVTMIDDIPQFTTYVGPITVTVDATSTYIPLPPTVKVQLDQDLGIGASVEIKYIVRVTGRPPTGTIINFTDVSYSYEIPGGTKTETISANSNATTIMAPMPPIVPNYTVETCKNGAITGTVVGIDIDGRYPLSYSIYTAPSNGFAAIDSTTGVWHYTPKVGFVGTDSFVVQVRDSAQADAYSTITINVLDISCCELSCRKCNCNSCCN